MTSPVSKAKDEFRRCAIRLLTKQPKLGGGQQVLMLDGLHMVWRPNSGLAVACLKEKRMPIWDDAAGGCLIKDIEPYYDILRRKFVLDELADI